MRDDLRYALRSLLNSRGFTAVALLVIAASVAAITPIFSIVDAAWLRPLPYPDSHRLVVLYDGGIPIGQGRLPLSQRSYLEWAERQQGFEGIAAYRGGFSEATVDGDQIDAWSTRISGNFFGILRQRPQLGQFFTEDDVARDRRAAVLSHALWVRVFGARQDVLGQIVQVQGVSYEVIGVAAPGFSFPAGSTRPYEIFLPLVVPPAQRALAPGGAPFLTAIARLRDGVSQEEAQRAVDGVAAGLARAYPGWDAMAQLQPYHEYVTGRSTSWMRLLFAGVALLFLIMCANVANLLLARGASRRRELGVRTALGASRARIARQLMFESLLLAAAGTAAGVVAGSWILDGFRTAIPASVPRIAEIGLDWRIVSIAGIAVFVTGGLFGIAPSFFATRVDVNSALKTGRASTSPGGARFRSVLVVAEIAVALVLLAGAVMFSASFLKVTSIPLGVDYRNVIVTALEDRSPRGTGPNIMSEMWARADQFHVRAEQIVERVRAVPGVDDVAAASSFPFSPGLSTFSYELPGRPDFKWTRGEHAMVAMKMVSPNYLQLLRIPLLRGRYLSAADTSDAEGAVVLSESASRLIFPGQDPIGQLIDLQKHLRVVGIVADVRMGGPEKEPYPDVYVPMTQGRGTLATALVIRTALPAEQLLPSIRAAMQAVDPGQRVRVASTLESYLDTILAQRRFNMLVLGSFGALGLLIAAIGLYGVMAFLVTERTHEIGVRVALGASRGRVLRLVLRRAGVLVALGAAGGAIGMYYFSASAQAFLYEMKPLEPRVVGVAAALLCATAFVAAFIPARRAASVDPLIALRHD